MSEHLPRREKFAWGMGEMLFIENESSFKAALRREANLFVGAGFSVLAKDKNNRDLPTGAQLVTELCQEFGQSLFLDRPLMQVAQIIKSSDRARFNDFLIKRFTIGDYDKRYNSISNFEIPRIFTTNIDDLFWNIYNKSIGKYINDVVLQGATFGDAAAVEYLPLHGSVTYPEPDFTFTPIEVSSAFSSNPTQFQYLVNCLNKSPTIFLGYALEDAGALQALNTAFGSGSPDKARWLQLRKADPAAEAYFKSLGFQIIIGDTDAVLDFFENESKNTGKKEPQKISNADFGSGTIPTLQNAAVRPIMDFYQGHAPVWHDVLTQRIPKTEKYKALVNQIDAGRHVLLSGIPVSGKSTLLMQAAAYLETGRVKLFEDAVTKEKAQAIVRLSSGKGDVIIFIDNIGDSVDAIDTLTSANNIQVVGADRSVNIGFGSHRFDAGKFVSIDCSDLEQSDFPRIFEAIPPAIRISRMEIPQVDSKYKPSIFEFIERNVKGQNISDRYRDVLRHLRQRQIDIHDLFVMICYVYSCHAPVSFDVVGRFTQSGGAYGKVYDLVERLGKLLSEVDTTDAQFVDLDDSQDHFTPRSNLISETVVRMCRNEDFRRVFLNFHANVPRLFIPRYSNFRRYGYRAAFADRVFPDWKDAEKFYMNAYKEDQSYFLKQQLAIHLGGRKQFALAFKYIDEALNESHNRNPNIRHTHARLLFDANIEKAATDSSLREHLRKSMEILESCHDYDKRQTNHALRFAEQSLKYSSVFPGFEADSYRSKATGWLSEEIEKTPSLRHAKSLLRQLQRQ